MEFFEDVYEKDPKASLDVIRDESGEITLDEELLGDPLLAKWEKEMAMGLEPDLEEGMSDTARKKLAFDRAKAGKLLSSQHKLDTELNKPLYDPRYKEKSIIIGSEEELEMLKDGLMGRGKTEGFDPEEDLIGYRKRR